MLERGAKIGAYVIESHLGTGGMGSVYAVENSITGDKRALKIIRSDVSADASFRARFVREIKAAMAVNHPNVVRVFEPGKDQDVIYLPMELFEGETLSQKLKRDGRIPIDEAVRIAKDVARGLEAVHAASLVHRDIKPSNIFLTRIGSEIVPKLLDLGAVKRLNTDDDATRAGDPIGTEPYMSPEQARGAESIDARADQFGFGVVFYQMLTGLRPWERDSASSASAKIMAGVPFKPPTQLDGSIPRLLEEIILRCLSHDRDGRYAGMAELAAALDAFRPRGAEETKHAPLEPRARPIPIELATTSPVMATASRSATKVRSSVVIAAIVVASVVVVWRVAGSNLPPEESKLAVSAPRTSTTPSTVIEPVATATAPPPTASNPPIVPLVEADASKPLNVERSRTPTTPATRIDAGSPTARPCVTPEGLPCDL